jgi:hypothetical protein
MSSAPQQKLSKKNPDLRPAFFLQNTKNSTQASRYSTHSLRSINHENDEIIIRAMKLQKCWSKPWPLKTKATNPTHALL